MNMINTIMLDWFEYVMLKATYYVTHLSIVSSYSCFAVFTGRQAGFNLKKIPVEALRDDYSKLTTN